MKADDVMRIRRPPSTEVQMDLPALFQGVAERMRADLTTARASLTHSGMKGDAFEATFRSFLKQYVPKTLDVSPGILVDSSGAQSRQLDVILSDAAKTPVLFSSGESRVVPIECAYMVFEVKARLDVAELDRCFENMLSVRRLAKTAYLVPSLIQTQVLSYGGTYDIYPVNYFVFAYDSIDLFEIGRHMVARSTADHLPYTSRLDTICVLDKGIICNTLPNGTYDALPAPGSNLQICRTDQSLLLFYALLSRYFNQAQMPCFRFTDYLGNMAFEDRASG